MLTIYRITMEKQRAKFFPQKYSYQKKLIVLLVKSINNINWRLKVVIALCKLFILSFTFKKKKNHCLYVSTKQRTPFRPINSKICKIRNNSKCSCINFVHMPINEKNVRSLTLHARWWIDEWRISHVSCDTGSTHSSTLYVWYIYIFMNWHIERSRIYTHR